MAPDGEGRKKSRNRGVPKFSCYIADMSVFNRKQWDVRCGACGKRPAERDYGIYPSCCGQRFRFPDPEAGTGDESAALAGLGLLQVSCPNGDIYYVSRQPSSVIIRLLRGGLWYAAGARRDESLEAFIARAKEHDQLVAALTPNC